MTFTETPIMFDPNENRKENELLEQLPFTQISPTKGWTSLRLKQLWEYRELLYFFTWRDLKVRYKQTIMGTSWAILQPLITMIIFSLFFGKFVKMPSDGLPYPIFTFTALVPWTFFANGLLQSSNVLVNNPDMIKKIYFPRLTMPIASILASLVDFALAFIVLLGMIFYYRIPPSLNILWTPILLILAFITALGFGFWFSAMNAQFRDIRYVVPFVIQIWLFSTPIAYPSSIVPERWRIIYGLNPMVGVIEGFRWALLGTNMNIGPMILISSVISIIVLISGAYYFRRMEKVFADII